VSNNFSDPETPTADDVKELYGSKYLSAEDLGNKKIRTRVGKVRKEPMQARDGKPERAKLVLYFTSDIKPLILNATNKNVLVDVLGGTPADWESVEVGLWAEPTMYAGKPTKGVRLRVLSASKPEPKPATAPKPAAPAAVADAEMPWGDPEDPGHTGEDVQFGEAAEAAE
jgi:hypothetical protein